MDSRELHAALAGSTVLQLQLLRTVAVAHVLHSGATVFPDVWVRTVSHAVPGEVVVTRHGSHHVHGSSFVYALVSWKNFETLKTNVPD